MKKQTSTKEKVNELERMRQRTAELEKVDAKRKRAEETPALAAAHWQDTFDAMEDMVVIIDKDFHIVRANRAMDKAFAGVKVLGAHCYELMHGTEGPIPNCPSYQTFSSGEAAHAEVCEQHLGSRCFDISTYPVKDNDGTVQQVVHVTRDITGRKRVEKALRESEEKLRVTFESISDAVAVIDLEGRFTQVNEAAARMTGYTKEELVGRNVLDTMIAKKDHDKIVLDMAKTLEEGGALGIRSYTLVTKDGREFESEFSTAVLRDSSGNVINLIGVARDVTERKRAEKERERLLAELEDKSKEMKQLLFVASHDLRSPLVNIQGFTREIERSLQQVHSVLEEEDVPSAVKEKLAAPIEEGIADSLSYILASTSKIDTLLTGLLKLSRLGQVAITIEKLNMSELMAEVVDGFEFQTKEAGVKLEVGKLPPCQGDKAQINQVFSNLIGNALKYLDPERPGVIRVSGGKEDSKAVYTVEDNGIGIAPEHQETVFQIFQRVGSSTSSGEGLGLTIVRRILDRHGGKVWLESEPGRGSRFHVSLPIGD